MSEPALLIEEFAPDIEAQPDIVGAGQLRLAMRALRSNKLAMGGLSLVVVIVLLAVLAPWLARHNPDSIDVLNLNKGPSAGHWLGTDYLGRDVWARVLYGGRVSLPAALEVVVISFGVGVPLGITAGYGPKALNEVIMRVMDMLLSVPGILLAICVVTMLGTGLESAVAAVGVAGIPGFARVAHGSTLEVKYREYVQASIAQGAGPSHIMRRHILPNIVAPLVVLSTLDISGAILATAALSYLGLGSQPPTADWGTMLAEGYNNMFLSPGQLVFPGIMIFLSVLGVNLLGDGLGEALTPNLRKPS